MVLALIAAAGSGSRTGLEENKIFFPLEDGQTIIEKTVNAFLNATNIDEVCIITRQEDIFRLKELFGDSVTYCLGGKTRGESVLNGLIQNKGRFNKVLVHDGARPFITEEIINNVIDGISEKMGAVAGVKVTDTIKVTDKKLKIVSTPERETLWAAQTPQGFNFDELLYAYNKSGTVLTDDAAVFEQAGMHVKMVEGGYFNKKITTKEDVKMPQFFLNGIGFDVHQLVENRPLILGGVEIPHVKGLLGHSDADVLIHAIMDALLGATGLGDIGKHFPDTDEKYKGISSMKLFEHVINLLNENGYQVVNISAVIMAQKPKLSPYIKTMNENIAKCAKIHINRVNVAATTTEKLGFVGREEGISAQAIVTVKN